MPANSIGETEENHVGSDSSPVNAIPTIEAGPGEEGRLTSDQSTPDAIATVLQEHVDAVNNTDVELLLKGFTDDVVYIAPGAAPILGKAAMREYITPIYARASIRIGIKPEALEVDGDRAVEWGTCRGEMTLGEEGPIPVNLQYILVYRREAFGGWRISHDITTPGPT